MALVAWSAVTLGGLTGTVLRLWYLFHRPTSSDEAIPGLMADQILHGHFWAFYWGQPYGGVEPYLIAPLFALFGSSPWALTAVPTVLSVVATVLVWAVTRRLVEQRYVAVLAATLFWATPVVGAYNSTLEYGFRMVAINCGLGSVLLALRILDGHHRSVDLIGLGLVAGLGWWSSPELTYYLLPSGLLLLGAAWRDNDIGWARRWLGRLALVAAAGIVASLPWWWHNFTRGFTSLNTKSGGGVHGVTYTDRLQTYFHYSFFLLFNIHDPFLPLWLTWIWPVLAVALIVVLVGAVILSVLRGGRALAIGVGAVCYPLILAAIPATWYWNDGRYAWVGFPLFVFILAIACDELPPRVAMWLNAGSGAEGRPVDGTALGSRPGHSPAPHQALLHLSQHRDLSFGGRSESFGAAGMIAAVVVTALVGLTLWSFLTVVVPAGRFFQHWEDPNGPSQAAAARLQAAGVQDGYADYWVAYHLDFLDRQLRLSPGPIDLRRWPGLEPQVRKDPRAAFVFAAKTSTASQQFGQSVQGPDQQPEWYVQKVLHYWHVPYHTVDAGVASAVIPEAPLTPAQTTVLLTPPALLPKPTR